MELHHIELTRLKTTKLNVRKYRAKETADLEAGIRSLGIIQPLLVRANCEGFEVVAGQRRFHALSKLAEEASEQGNSFDPVPCIVMEEGDDAKAIEASLAENVARLPMDEVDQYKAFSTLSKQGQSVETIAAHFGITERAVKQRLALGDLHPPLLTAYRKQQISASTIRSLTLATTKQQKEWWALFNSQDYAPQGHALKEWLFGGASIRVENALFNREDYSGAVISDLFEEAVFFDDATQFWELQNKAIAEAKAGYLAKGWQEVVILDVGEYWSQYDHAEASKKEGGRVYVRIAYSGEVTFHEGYVTRKEAERRARQEAGETVSPVTRPELTKSMQDYLALHRHSAVRTDLLNHQAVALRLAVAQIIAGSNLWTIHADPQKAKCEAIKDSLSGNKAEAVFAEERQEVLDLLAMDKANAETLVFKKDDWSKSHDVYMVFAKLLELDDASVSRVLTFVVAETLPCGSALVEILGKVLDVDMADHWQPDQTFFDLFRDKEAINACVKQAAGKNAAEAHISSTAKVQKSILQKCLSGERNSGNKDWQPRYMSFPMGTYTKRGGIEAVDQWKSVKKHFKCAA